MLTMRYAGGPGLFTPSSMASTLRQYGQRMDVPILVGMDRGLGQARGTAINSFIRRGVGRRVFGQKTRGALGLIKVVPAKMTGGRYVGTLKAIGLAAIQEAGGRTAWHLIPKKARNKVLALRTGGFVNVKKNPLRHPGATHPAMPFLEDALQKASARVAREIEREMERLAVKLKVA